MAGWGWNRPAAESLVIFMVDLAQRKVEPLVQAVFEGQAEALTWL